MGTSGHWTLKNNFWTDSTTRISKFLIRLPFHFTISKLDLLSVHLMDIKGTLHSFFRNGLIMKHTENGIENHFGPRGIHDDEDTIVGLIPYYI